MPKPFEFELNEEVQLILSDERGIVLGRCEYLTAENCYWLRYRAADGRMVEQWWGETALRSKESAEN